MIRITILFAFVGCLISHSHSFSQNRNYMEANGGFMRYSSSQNNLSLNPTFGLTVYNRATEHFGLEVYCNAAAIDEDVKYKYDTGTEVRHEKFLTGWIGIRGAFGTHTPSYLMQGFVGFALRLDRNAVGPEIGIKYGHQLFQSHFWLHASTYVQFDKYAFYNFDEPSAEGGPIQAGIFGQMKLGIACHFN